MNESPAISVIIPFHNAERTLERTLLSLEKQTLTNVEYIFVDDGSNDRSVELLQTFMALHPDFHGRHKLVRLPAQSGCAHAQMHGLRNARGHYISRCDADDYLEPNALRLMLDATLGGVVDIVMGPMFQEYPDRRNVLEFKRNPASLNDMRIDTLNFSYCNKLIRRSLLDDNGIEPFDGIDCWEDLGVVARCMALKPKVNFIQLPLYHYVRNPSATSLSRSGNDRLLRDHLMMALLLEQWFDERGLHEENEEFLDHLKFSAKVKLLRGRDKDVARWKETFPEVNGKIMRLRHIRLPHRILFSIVAWLPAGLVQKIADLCQVFYPNSKAEAATRRPDEPHPNIPAGDGSDRHNPVK